MFSISIKVLNKDNRFGGRNIDVSFGSFSFKTPNRTATHKEYNAVSSLPHDITIDNPVSEYVSSFDDRSLSAFLSGNGSFKDRKGKISVSIDKMRYFPIMSTIKIPSTRQVTQDQLMLFDQFQKDDFEVISIPQFEYKKIDEFENLIIRFSDFARIRGQEAMPIIPLSTKLDIFKQQFNVLKKLNNDNGICKVIGFAYANPFSHIQQFQTIYENRAENIWYHVFGVPKTPRGKSVAHIHELQNWGLDTFSPEVRYTSPKAMRRYIMESKKIKAHEVECPKRFDAQTLGAFKEKDWIGRYGHDICCNCPVCRGKDLLAFKDVFTHDLDGSFAPSLLYGADRVHTLASGSLEFKESMESIKSDDLPAYYSEKEFTKSRELIKFLGSSLK